MGDKDSDLKKLLPHEMHNSELVSKLMGKMNKAKVAEQFLIDSL